MNKATVSIIIPLYNRKLLVGKTIESVINQTYPNWELVVVDDGSTDGSEQVIEQYSQHDERIILYRRDREPKGAPTCRNIGVEKCTGDYIIFLDSDDLLAPFCLEERVKKFRKYPDQDFLVFPMAFFSNTPDDAQYLWNELDKPLNDIDRFLTKDGPWQTTGPIWKKSSIINIKLWKEDILSKQDLELHLRAVILDLKYKKFPKVHDCFYRSVKGESISKDVLIDKKKTLSWFGVYQSIYAYLLRNKKLTTQRKKLIAYNILNIAFNNYALSKDFFYPRIYLAFLQEKKLLPRREYYKAYYYLFLLYFLDKLGMRKISMYLYGNRTKNLFKEFCEMFLFKIKLDKEIKENMIMRYNKLLNEPVN